MQSGLSWIQSLLFQAFPLAPAFTVRHALFGFSSDELRCLPWVFCYLLNVCKFEVWSQRNDFRLRNVALGASQLIACIRPRLRFYLPLSFKRFSSARRRGFFLRQWGANGVLARYVARVFATLFSFLLFPLSSVLGLVSGRILRF